MRARSSPRCSGVPRTHALSQCRMCHGRMRVPSSLQCLCRWSMRNKRLAHSATRPRRARQHTRTHARTLAHTHAHTLAHTHARPPARSLARPASPRSLSPSLARTRSHDRTLASSLARSPARSFKFTLTLARTVARSLARLLALTRSHAAVSSATAVPNPERWRQRAMRVPFRLGARCQ